MPIAGLQVASGTLYMQFVRRTPGYVYSPPNLVNCSSSVSKSYNASRCSRSCFFVLVQTGDETQTDALAWGVGEAMQTEEAAAEEGTQPLPPPPIP